MQTESKTEETSPTKMEMENNNNNNNNKSNTDCNPNKNKNQNAIEQVNTKTALTESNGSVVKLAKKDRKKRKKKKKKKSKKQQNLPPGYKRVQKELQTLLLKPPIGVRACPKTQDDLLHWIATVQGPENTPYEGGQFYLNICFGEQYPFQPPKVTFKTKIYHCNVNSANGEICLDVLKDNYSPALTVEKILLSIMALLQEPNPDDPLVGEIAKIYIADRETHDDTAKTWTKRYAMTDES